MRAAQHDGVGAALHQRSNVARDQRFGVSPFEFRLLDLFRKAGAGLHEDPDAPAVLLHQAREPVARDGLAGGQDTDDSRAGEPRGGLHGGLDGHD